MRCTRTLALVGALAMLGLPSLARADFTSCRLEYHVHVWSVFYENVSGTGTVVCDNGERARVRIQMYGGGLTLGSSDLTGQGRFSQARGIGEIFGTYGSAEAHAGVVRSVEGRVLTKGPVWLSMAGNGRGFDLGFAFGGFSIRR
jgi:hypothetical protein